MKATIYLFAIFMGIFNVPHLAHAMDNPACQSAGEAIVKLKAPIFNTPTVWNAFYGQDGMDHINDITPAHDDAAAIKAGIKESHYLIVGNHTKDESDSIIKPFIAKIDNRGRVIWEKRIDSGAHKTARRVIKTSNGYAVLGDVKNASGRQGFYIDTYNKEGDRARAIPIYEKGHDLSALSFAPSASGKSMIVSAVRHESGADNKAGDKAGEAVIYKITLAGKRLWRRQYAPGSVAQFNDISKDADGNYTLVGEIALGGAGKAVPAGWIIRLDGNGALMWQKTYPRGRGASLLAVQGLSDGGIITSGTVKGVGVKNDGAWVMKTNVSGAVEWQRYYQGRNPYKAIDLLVHERLDNDGRISVLVDGRSNRTLGQGRRQAARGHVSLLTLTPLGQMLGAQYYTDGQNVSGRSLAFGHNFERMVVGSAQSMMANEGTESAGASFVDDGWVFAGTALDRYENPCTPNF